MCGRVVLGLVPDAGVGFSGEPLVVLCAQADDGGTLSGREVVGGDADRPAKARGLRDDLAGGVLVAGAADALDRLHLFDGREELHPDRRHADAQQRVQLIDERGPVVLVRLLDGDLVGADDSHRVPLVRPAGASRG